MNLLVDIGNTRIKWKIASGEFEGETNSVEYQRGTLIARLDKALSLDCPGFSNVYISNVAGEQIESLVFQWFVDNFGIIPQFALSLRQKCGLISAYKQPEQLGVDRFLAMIAACELHESPLVVVDCGTATTIDSINAQQEFIGGVILPGLGLMRCALSDGAEALPLVQQAEIIDVFSTDTGSAILSGTILATTMVIDNAVHTLAKLTGSEVKCIVTGGYGETICTYLQTPAEYYPDLVLNGLSAYFQAQ